MFYVSIADEDRLLTLRLESGNGSVEIIGEAEACGMPGPMCMDAERGLLYAGLRSAHQVAVYRVSHDTGLLTLIDTTPLAGDPCYISLDRSRRYLFAAYYHAGRVSVNPLHGDGHVGKTTQCLQSHRYAHCIETDSTNLFAYVPHVGSSNCIDRLRFDANTGLLKRTWWSRVRPPHGTGPRHYLFHPRLNLVYFSNEQGSSVSTYSYHRSSGKLRLLTTQSTLPGDWHGKNLSAQIRLHPSATALYVSNRGHDSIAVFDIAQHSGLPTLRRNVQTEACPRAFNLSADGQHLLVAGQKSGRLAVYRVSGNEGDLEPGQVIEIGANPLWIEPLQLR